MSTDEPTHTLYDFEDDAISVDELREAAENEREKASEQMVKFDPEEDQQYHYWEGRYGSATLFLNTLDGLNKTYGRDPNDN